MKPFRIAHGGRGTHVKNILPRSFPANHSKDTNPDFRKSAGLDSRADLLSIPWTRFQEPKERGRDDIRFRKTVIANASERTNLLLAPQFQLPSDSRPPLHFALLRVIRGQ